MIEKIADNWDYIVAIGKGECSYTAGEAKALAAAIPVIKGQP